MILVQASNKSYFIHYGFSFTIFHVCVKGSFASIVTTMKFNGKNICHFLTLLLQPLKPAPSTATLSKAKDQFLIASLKTKTGLISWHILATIRVSSA